MIVYEWVIRSLFLLLSLRIVNTEPIFGSCSGFDYCDGPNPIPPPPNPNVGFNPGSIGIPSYINPAASLPLFPISCVNPCNNTAINGNNLYLVVDPVTQKLSIQITPPCNSNSPSNGGPLGGPPNISGPIGGLPNIGGADGGTGTCSLITLLLDIVNALLGIVSSAVTTLLKNISQIVKNLLNSVLGSLLGGLLTEIEKLLTTILGGTVTELQKLIETSGLVGGTTPSPLQALLDGVGGLLGPANPATGGITQLLNNTLQPVLDEVQKLIDSLLSPQQGLIPELTTNITILVNNTLVDLLDDVDKLVTDLLNDVFGNGLSAAANSTLGSNSSISPLINNFTKNVEILLTDVLNDTICDVEKLLNDTGSLAAVIEDLQKLVDDLLADILLDVGKLVDDKLTNALGKGGLLDDLLKNIEKLLTDLLTNLLGQKITAVSNSSLLAPGSQAGLLENLLKTLNESLNLPAPVPPIPDVPPLSTQILGLVNNTLNELIGGLDRLLTGMQSNATTAVMVTGPVSSITQALDNLLQGLIDSLLGQVKILVSGSLGNITGVINLPQLTSPIGTTVTSILKGVLGCNLTCVPGGPILPPVTLPPITQKPPITPFPPTNKPPNCDPSCFVSLLEQYQQAVAQSICRSVSANSNPCNIVNSLLNRGSPCARASDYDDYGNIDELPSQLLSGLDKIVELTRNLAGNGLVKLVCTASQNANSSDSLMLPSL